MYVCNPQNAYFYYLPFNGDQRLIYERRIYRVNDDIVERLNSGSIIEVYANIT